MQAGLNMQRRLTKSSFNLDTTLFGDSQTISNTEDFLPFTAGNFVADAGINDVHPTLSGDEKQTPMLEARRALVEIGKRVADAVGKYENATQQELLSLVEIDAKRTIPIVYRNVREMMTANKVRIDTYLSRQDDNRKQQQKELFEASKVLAKIQNLLDQDMPKNKSAKKLVTLRDAMDAEEERLVEDTLLHAEHVMHLDLHSEQTRQEQNCQKLHITADRISKHVRMLMELKANMAKKESSSLDHHMQFLENKSMDQYREILRLRKMLQATEIERDLERKESASLRLKIDELEEKIKTSVAQVGDAEGLMQARNKQIQKLERQLESQKLLVRTLNKKIAQASSSSSPHHIKDVSQESFRSKGDFSHSSLHVTDVESEVDPEDDDNASVASTSFVDKMPIDELRSELRAAKSLVSTLNAGLVRKDKECDLLKVKASKLLSEVESFRNRPITDLQPVISSSTMQSQQAVPDKVEQRMENYVEKSTYEMQLAEAEGWKRKFQQVSQQLMDARETINTMKKKHLEMVEVSTALIEAENKLSEEVQMLRSSVKRHMETARDLRQKATRTIGSVEQPLPARQSSSEDGRGGISHAEKVEHASQKLTNMRVTMLERELSQHKKDAEHALHAALEKQRKEHQHTLDRLKRASMGAQAARGDAKKTILDLQHELAELSADLVKKDQQHARQMTELKVKLVKELEEAKEEAKEELELQEASHQRALSALRSELEAQAEKLQRTTKVHQELLFMQTVAQQDESMPSEEEPPSEEDDKPTVMRLRRRSISENNKRVLQNQGSKVGAQLLRMGTANNQKASSGAVTEAEIKVLRFKIKTLRDEVDALKKAKADSNQQIRKLRQNLRERDASMSSMSPFPNSTVQSIAKAETDSDEQTGSPRSGQQSILSNDSSNSPRVPEYEGAKSASFTPQIHSGQHQLVPFQSENASQLSMLLEQPQQDPAIFLLTNGDDMLESEASATGDESQTKVTRKLEDKSAEVKSLRLRIAELEDALFGNQVSNSNDTGDSRRYFQTRNRMNQDGEPLEVRQFTPGSNENNASLRQRTYSLYCKLTREARTHRATHAWRALFQQLLHRHRLLSSFEDQLNDSAVLQLWTIWFARSQRVWHARREMCREREIKIDTALYATVKHMYREEMANIPEQPESDRKTVPRIDPQKVLLHQLMGPCVTHNILPISNAVLPTQRQSVVPVHLTSQQIERIMIIEPFIPSSMGSSDTDVPLRCKIISEIVQYVLHGQQADPKESMAPMPTPREREELQQVSKRPQRHQIAFEPSDFNKSSKEKKTASIGYCGISRTPTRPNTTPYSQRQHGPGARGPGQRFLRPQSSRNRSPAANYVGFSGIVTPHHDLRSFSPPY